MLKNILQKLKYRSHKPILKNQEIGWASYCETWEEAKLKSSGYDDCEILKRCKESALSVKNGDYAYERDSVLFDKIQYSWPLLSSLLHVSSATSNKLALIDFGGSFGSSYYQNRHFLQHIDLSWLVVEQKNFVESGRKFFEDDKLKFYYDFSSALNSHHKPNCILLSSVLQYLENPEILIDEIIGSQIEFIIIDRTGFTGRNKDLVTVQTVPPEIYNASYPCWFFNESAFLDRFMDKYKVVAEFNDSFTPPVYLASDYCYWKGFFLEKITNA